MDLRLSVIAGLTRNLLLIGDSVSSTVIGTLGSAKNDKIYIVTNSKTP